jgi:FkbM family methyltransferase
MTHRLVAAANLLMRPGPDWRVPPYWLLVRPSLLNRRFKARAHVEVELEGELQRVTVNGARFVWPREAPVSALLDLIAELKLPYHPNQYLWGQTRIHGNDVVIDIGACEGGFAAQAAERGAQVIAVEPSRIMAVIIRSLFSLRRLPAPVVVGCLLGQTHDWLHFTDNTSNPGASRVARKAQSGSYPVEVITLDGLVERLGLDRVDFIKCDAEGADVEIIKSGPELLRRFHPRLALSTYHGDADYRELHSFLRSFGYRIRGKGFQNVNGRYRVVMLHAW